MSLSTGRLIVYEEKLLPFGLVGCFGRQCVDAPRHSRFNTSCGVPMHRAGRRKPVEFPRQILKLILCLARIAGVDGGFQMLDLCFHDALSRTVDHAPLGVLTDPFFG